LAIKRIVDECEKKTTELVLEKKDLIQKLSDRLLEKETLDLIEIVNILGQRPFTPKSSFKAFLEEVQRTEEENKISTAK
jgi:AFG3 family protein